MPEGLALITALTNSVEDLNLAESSAETEGICRGNKVLVKVFPNQSQM